MKRLECAMLVTLLLLVIAIPLARAEDSIHQGETRTTATVWVWGEHGWEKREIPPKTHIGIYWYSDNWVRNAPADAPQYIRRHEVFIFGIDTYKVFFPALRKQKAEQTTFGRAGQCTNKVHREGNRLVFNGREIKLVGANATYLLADWFPEDEWEDVLSFVSQHGNTVRLWVFPGVDLGKLERLLKLGGKYNLFFIITLDNFQSVPEYAHHGQSFFDTGYVEEYLFHVRRVVSRFKDFKEIAAWQLMNEPNPWGWPWGWKRRGIEAFEMWIKNCTLEIRRIDPCHPISIGLIRLGKVGEKNPKEWWKKIHRESCVDLVTAHVHTYQGEGEIAIANELNLPIVFTEVYHKRGDLQKRAKRIGEFAEDRFNRGADGFLLWQLAPSTRAVWDLEFEKNDPTWEVWGRYTR